MTETTPEQIELLPCPFCGPGNSLCDPWFDDVSKRWRVGCGRCGASTGTHPRDTGKEVAIAAWNSRHNAQAEQIEQAIIDRLNGVPPKVWVIIVDHGRDASQTVSIHLSEAGAKRTLAAYCREEWDDQGVGYSLPDDDGAAVADYFEFWDEESYSLYQERVKD